MTDLEQRIYEDAKKVVALFEKEISSDAKILSPYYVVPFISQGAIDELIWDSYERRFTKINYWVGVGKPNIFNCFDEYKRQSFDLPIDGEEQ